MKTADLTQLTIEISVSADTTSGSNTAFPLHNNTVLSVFTQIGRLPVGSSVISSH